MPDHPIPPTVSGLPTRDRVERFLARCAVLPPTVAARLFVRLDAARIRAAADTVDRRRVEGTAGPLAGLTVSIKDLFDEAGEVTAAGSIMLKDAAPATEDAPAIARLKTAGAVPFGRTTMSEFAYSGVGLNPHYGTCGNAVAGDRIPGGSTSGGAVAVALGLTDAALGSDTGGSIRIPAAFNGLAGFKPSRQAVPTDGAFPLAKSYDSVGPLAPDMETCARLHAVLSGTAGRMDREAGVAGLTFATLDPQLTDGMDDATAADFHRALGRLSSAGANIQPLTIPELSEAPGANRIIVATEAYAVHEAHLDQLSREADPRVRIRLQVAEKANDAEVREAYAAFEAARSAWRKASTTVDAILAPTVPIVPPKLLDVASDFDRLNGFILRNPSTLNFADACAASVPMQEAGALPTGLMVAAANGADWRCLDLAARIALIVSPQGGGR